jgi:hypothetical protein
VAVESDFPSELAPVVARAKRAGLRNLGFSASKANHYLGVGDSPTLFRDQALAICEKLATVYRDYFEAKGFTLSPPADRLVVVVLKDKASYRSFVGDAEGAEVGAEVGGHYDVDANQLVVFDSVHNDDGGAGSARVNTFTLVHEAIHQLTYNSGLLERRGDVPVAISEGLATFGELWQHSNRRSTLGVKNSARLSAFTQSESPVGWIPIEELLTKDELFSDAEAAQIAYAESWVLVHYFLRTPTKLPKFRAYLDAVRQRREPAHRLDDARTHLGDLDRLDKALRQYRDKQLRP